MIFSDLLFAFFVALLLSTVFTLGFHRYGPWPSFVFFVVVLLAAWAGGIWFAPEGPFTWRLYWVPSLVIGFLVAPILAASAPRPPLFSTWRVGTARQLGRE